MVPLFIFSVSCTLLSVILSEEVNLVIVGLQPGLTNPSRFLPTDSQNGAWAWEGVNHLNDLGKMQGFAFGQYLRDRYKSLVAIDFFDDEFLGISCSETKCQNTLLSLYAGLFPPSSRAKFNSKLAWQPVPLHLNDEALGLSQLNCKYSQDLKERHLNSTDKIKENASLSDLSVYLAKNSGVKHTMYGFVDVFENWRSMKSVKAPVPAYLENPTLQGYSSKILYEKLADLEDYSHQICSSDESCRKMAASYWLYKLVELIQDKSGQNFSRKMIINVAETDNMMSLMKLLKAEDFSSETTSGFLIELKLQPTPVLRFITHSLFNETDSVKLYDRKLNYQKLSFCNYVEWCPIDTFVQHVKPDSTSLPLCSASSATRSLVMLVLVCVIVPVAVKLNML